MLRLIKSNIFYMFILVSIFLLVWPTYEALQLLQNILYTVLLLLPVLLLSLCLLIKLVSLFKIL